ncbi:MAG: transposase [Pseudonocardiaceae bacterium]
MTRFRTTGHLTSRAGLCPGHHDSTGKRKSGTTRHGNRWLRTALGTAAMAASGPRTPPTSAPPTTASPHDSGRRKRSSRGNIPP